MINLKSFCAKDNYRHMEIPWSRGAYTFATDGGIIVRVPKIPDIPDNANSPDALKLWAKVEIGNLEWTANLPDLPPVKMTPCEDCLGESRAAIRECEECGGMGNVRDVQNTVVDGMTYANKYLKLIKRLPGYKFYPVKHDLSISSVPPSYFTFDGGDGLLMPLRT